MPAAAKAWSIVVFLFGLISEKAFLFPDVAQVQNAGDESEHDKTNRSFCFIRGLVLRDARFAHHCWGSPMGFHRFKII